MRRFSELQRTVGEMEKQIGELLPLTEGRAQSLARTLAEELRELKG